MKEKRIQPEDYEKFAIYEGESNREKWMDEHQEVFVYNQYRDIRETFRRYRLKFDNEIVLAFDGEEDYWFTRIDLIPMGIQIHEYIEEDL